MFMIPLGTVSSLHLCRHPFSFVRFLFVLFSTVTSDDSTEEPAMSLEADNEPDRVKIREAQQRRALASELSESFGYIYSPSVCVVALKRCGDDQNSAARWLLDNGDELRIQITIPLVRRIVLASVEPNADTTPDMLQRCLIYATGHQLVFWLHHHQQPWSDGEAALARIHSLKDGSLVAEYKNPKLQRGGSGGFGVCFDYQNNVIWTAVLYNWLTFSSYTNHGKFTPQTDQKNQTKKNN
jgi:hypothetical protein